MTALACIASFGLLVEYTGMNEMRPLTMNGASKFVKFTWSTVMPLI